jgi:TIR domain
MTATAVTPKVFISYRRAETAGHAGRLYDATVARFGEHSVFMDVDLEAGVDFVEQITTAVGACRVLLVVMGPDWARAAHGASLPRLADPDDFVRLEVETALHDPSITVIPLLVAGARMPDAEKLPASLAPLSRRNALELSDGRWRFDVGRLVDRLEELLKELVADPPPPPGGLRERMLAQPFVASFLAPVLLAVLGALLGLLVGETLSPDAPPHTVPPSANLDSTAVRRAIAWGVVGGVLAACTCLRGGDRRQLVARALAGLALGAAAGVLNAELDVRAGAQMSPLPSSWDAKDIAVWAMALIGAVLGGVVGAMRTPRRLVAGVLGGAIGGMLAQRFIDGLPHRPNTGPNNYLQVSVQSFAIVGLALVAVLAVGALAAPARAAPADR